jgi:DNA-binding NarL/FixJ family response regulator
MKLRILLADDHEIVRRGLCALLQKREGWEVCGEASDGREAVEMAKKLKPDVVIVDIGMPSLMAWTPRANSCNMIPSLKSSCSPLPILIR